MMTTHIDYLAQARALKEKRHLDEVEAKARKDRIESIQYESVQHRLNELFGDLSKDMRIMSVVESLLDEHVWFASIELSSNKHRLGMITFVLRRDDRTNLPWEVDEGYIVYQSSYITWLSTGEWDVQLSQGVVIEDFTEALSYALDNYQKWDADQREANRRNVQGIRPDEPKRILSYEDKLIVALKNFIDAYTEDDPR